MKYDNENVYIYGTGSMGKGIYKDLLYNNIPVVGFIDHLDRQIEGAAVLRLDELQCTDNDIVILAVLNSEADIPKIVSTLSHFKHIVSVVDFYNFFGIKDSKVHFWLTDSSNYDLWQPEIDKAAGLWKDEKSRKLYADIIIYRKTGDITFLPQPEGGIYHPSDIPRWANPMRLMDCGAWIGDTIDALCSDYDIEEVLAFEPDLTPFIKLTEFMRENKTRISAFPYAVWSKEDRLKFNATADQSSQITSDGSIEVSCLPLDSFMAFAPTFIKMDIEGAELEALKGARETIEKYHPGLAISVYHKPEDIWVIPQWINEIGGYDFYLRPHAHSTFDTVMYAIPQ